VKETSYSYSSNLEQALNQLHQRVNGFRKVYGGLPKERLERLREYFRLKNIYNSNAIEGNTLTMGETQMVIQEGLTISGKPLKDTIEVHNLNNALEFFETLVKPENPPISLVDLRNIHSKICNDPAMLFEANRLIAIHKRAT
jgi:Fic family protein